MGQIVADPFKKYSNILNALEKPTPSEDCYKYFGELVNTECNLETVCELIERIICNRYNKKFCEKRIEDDNYDVYTYCYNLAYDMLVVIFNHVIDVNQLVKNGVYTLNVTKTDSSIFGEVRLFEDPDETSSPKCNLNLDIFEYSILLNHIVGTLPLITLYTDEKYGKHGGTTTEYRTFAILESVSLIVFNGKGIITSLKFKN